jgi:hypothetical protein
MDCCWLSLLYSEYVVFIQVAGVSFGVMFAYSSIRFIYLYVLNSLTSLTISIALLKRPFISMQV